MLSLPIWRAVTWPPPSPDPTQGIWIALRQREGPWDPGPQSWSSQKQRTWLPSPVGCLYLPQWPAGGAVSPALPSLRSGSAVGLCWCWRLGCILPRPLRGSLPASAGGFWWGQDVSQGWQRQHKLMACPSSQLLAILRGFSAAQVACS